MLKYHPFKLPRCRALYKSRNLRPLATSATLFSQTEPTPVSSTHSNLPTLVPEPCLKAPSSLHVGTSYEYLCARTLPLLGFTSLIRTGGRSDRGIDLLAHWTLPSGAQAPSAFDGKNTFQSRKDISAQNRVIKALIQCKAHARKPSPDMIRELEGAVSGAENEKEGVVGVLCAKREATAGVREAVRRCRRGVIWVMIEDPNEASESGVIENEKVDGVHEGRVGRIKQILWNEKVGKMVGGSVGAGVRYIPDAVKGKGAWWKEVVLMVDGRVWVPDGPGTEQGREDLESVEGLLVDIETRSGTG